ncbi:MAG: hypothetical protein RMJ97_10375 [Raineya sp.]|nr:hypothetical protein [Raineya sp.]MDW8297272.1 hypothetical protein [Raineya sp.]
MKELRFYEPDFIEAYVKGKVSEAERQAMQKLLAEDSNLANEVEFQKDLQEAIARTRKAELKQLLQNTPVPATTFMPTATQWFVGSVGVAALAVLTWLGLQYWDKWDKKESPIQNTSVVHIQPEHKSQEQLPKVVENTPITPENSTNQNSQKLTTENKQKQTPHRETQQKPFNKEIFYQYDGKNVLQIFGDFSYEIIEKVPTSEGEKDFIFIQNKFFELVPTPEDEVRNLKDNEVKNPDLIRLLSERLKNK